VVAVVQVSSTPHLRTDRRGNGNGSGNGCGH
jgi:hypothetical protein